MPCGNDPDAAGGVVPTPDHGWYPPPAIRWYTWGDYGRYTLTRRPTDYDHVVLPDWKPFLDDLQVLSVRQNRRRLITVVSAVAASGILTLLYQTLRSLFGDSNWAVAGIIVLLNFFGGILPVLDAWGGRRARRRTA
jgi:hypothetical protein